MLLHFNFTSKLLLLHIEQGGEVTTHRSTMRQCYYRQLKEEVGLANYIRTLSVGEQSPGTEDSEGGSYGGYFSAHTVNIHTQGQGTLYHPLEPHSGKVLPLSWDWPLGSLT